MDREEVCWLITTKCNQKCKYCHSFLNIADLTYEENKEILMKLINMGITHITWSGGEALLYPNIISLVKVAKQYGIKNKLITNGSIIAYNEKMREILDYLDTITLSIDTIDDDINEKMGRGKNHFKEIKTVLDLLKEKNVKTKINTVVNRLTLNHIQGLGEFLNNNYKINEWRIFKFIPLREVAKENQKIFEITNEEFLSKQEMFQSFKNIENVKYRNDEDMESKYILITANGDIVRTINKEDVVIGNALKQNLNELLGIMSHNSKRDYLIDKIRVLVSYNDNTVLNRFVNTINNLDYAKVVATASNATDTYNKIIESKPDMVFSKFDLDTIKKCEEKLEQNTPIFNLIENDINDNDLEQALKISGKKINSLVSEPYEDMITGILKDYKEYLYK